MLAKPVGIFGQVERANTGNGVHNLVAQWLIKFHIVHSRTVTQKRTTQMSHEYTTDEVRDNFMEHIRELIHYWSTIELPATLHDDDLIKRRVSGVVHSLLVTLDGGSAALPGFIVAPCPHEDDRQYHIDEDEDYYPENHNSIVNADISGYLHELLYKKE